MTDQHSTDPENHDPEKRSEKRYPPKQYYSVQFSLESLTGIYQFKIWNESKSGLCILVPDGSAILGHIKKGDIIEMAYYASEKPVTIKAFKTEIRHVTRHEAGRFRGHCLVGLRMLHE